MDKILQRMFLPVYVLLFLCPLPVVAADTMVRVAVDPSLPPYQFIKDGECVGVHIDLLDRIAQDAGLIVEYQLMDNMTRCMEALDAGRVDIVLGAVRVDGAEGAYTDPISQSSICMVVHNDMVDKLDGLPMVSAVYQNGTIPFTFMRNIRNIHYLPVSNQELAFRILVDGEVDALIGVKSSVLYQLEQAGLDDDYTIVNNYMIAIDYAMLVRPGDLELLAKLNNSLYRLRIGGDYENIHQRWVNESAYLVRVLWSRILRLGLIAGVAVVVILLLYTHYSRRLKRQVDEKTKALKQTNENLEKQMVLTQNSNELRNLVLENSPNAILVFDRDFHITLFNENARRLFAGQGLRLGGNVLELPLASRFLAHRQDTVFEGRREVRDEIVQRHPGGYETVYRHTLSLLYNTGETGDPVQGAILFIRDITEEHRVKEQAFERQKNLALNRMVAGVAHEIRNPLMSIKTYAELIPAKRDNPEFQRQMAVHVPREVDRVNALITDLIDYAKPRTGNREPVGVEELVQSCTALIRPLLDEGQIHLETDLEPGLAVVGDQNLLKQVLINILLNAVEAVKEKLEQHSAACPLELEIRAWSQGESRYIQIADQGMGMTAEEMSRATEPFFTTKETGTGLGLALSRQVMEDHGGALYLSSKKHRGTKITLRFGG